MKKVKPAPSIGSDFTFGADPKVTPQKFELSPSEKADLKKKGGVYVCNLYSGYKYNF